MNKIHWEVWNFRKSIKSIEKFYDKQLKMPKSRTIVKINIAACNIKKAWKLINELRGKSKEKIKASSISIIDGKLVTDRRKIADGFNTLFSSITKKKGCKNGLLNTLSCKFK